jgi:hypothetical protein
MKNQYVGDKSDYLKYALLRAIRRHTELPLEVCWMLTPDDRGQDGKDTGYLQQPGKYRRVDPELFDLLAELISDPARTVADIEAGPLQGAGFQSDWLSDSLGPRARYFDEVMASTKPRSLVFFDPDNGLEIASRAKGRRDSNKFLYWDETERLAPGRSLVIFQHWNRVARDQLVRVMREQILARFPDHQVFDLRGPKVLYLFVVLPADLEAMIAAAEQIAASWPKKLTIDYPGPLMPPAGGS